METNTMSYIFHKLSTFQIQPSSFVLNIFSKQLYLISTKEALLYFNY